MGDSLKDLINSMRQSLRNCGIENSELDAAVLIEEILGISRLDQIMQANLQLTETQINLANQALTRRTQHEPIAYIIGKKEFWGREFLVDQNVLIPRPETELLIEEAKKLSPHPKHILDLGTGSGCLGITLALEFPTSTVTAIDLQENALLVAKKNAQRLKADNIKFIKSNWLSNLEPSHQFELIVANPPYIEEGCILPRSVKNFEPHSALFAGKSGLQDYEIIATELPKFCNNRSTILLEIGFNQAAQVSDIFKKHFSTNISTLKDLAGNDRMIKISP